MSAISSKTNRNKVRNTISLLTLGAIVLSVAVSCGGNQSAKVKETNMGNAENKNEKTIFPKGEKAPAENFTGTVWVKILVQKNENISYSIGNVTFEPGARSNWHTHPAGQILLVTEGGGLYQEKGKPIKAISKGDVIVCDPDIEHWHGASSESGMTHVAVTNTKNDVGVVWLKPVTDEEYNAVKND